ncbi:Purine efflux pump PbuE [Arthrobacter ulcerisalmonis]|uniref:Purine efflux pump PbuE n=1 Tax=Arthrobacter ulcerisalmonis TaxID=2483813 RepID=A0A3P5X7S6_9MICC|nr:MFS transporter [Arthrobacter ulcerisalmonis]VDC26326.1 Purine efflux pump PbuE [Arthrobacter ulcerisalmonis]
MPTQATHNQSGTGAARTPPSRAGRPKLPLVVYVLALGTFLMLTSEFVVAGILPQIAGDLGVTVAQAGLLITVFAIGMVVGAPVMALLTLRLSKRLTLILALVVFVAGHVVVALGPDFTVLLVARFVSALATGAFWAVSAVVATRAAGPSSGARAVGVVGAGGALATVLGVPLGAMVAQLVGWRGTFWALAVAAVVAAVLVARLVPRDAAGHQSASIRKELAGLRSGKLWLALAACATTSGGVLSAYTYIATILTDQAGVTAALVPLVLTGFGVGSVLGTLIASRLGDAHPGAVTIVTPAVTTVLLLGISVSSGAPWLTSGLVLLLGLFGLSANSVLIHLSVSFAGEAATLGSALAVSAFNAGTAVGTAIAAVALTSSLGTGGPALVGTFVVALTLIPTVILALGRRSPRLES